MEPIVASHSSAVATVRSGNIRLKPGQSKMLYPNAVYDNDLIGEEIELGQKKTVQVNKLGQKIIRVNHPGYFADWGYGGMIKLSNIIFNGLSCSTPALYVNAAKHRVIQCPLPYV